MDGPGSGLLEDQSHFEQCVICLICLSPKLHMVYGSCQHKVCVECLYTGQGNIRKVMERCPFCQKLGAFPCSRPEIPEDNVMLQRCLGVTVCPQFDCGAQLWAWEISEHLLSVHHHSPPRKTPCVKKRKTVREEELKVPLGTDDDNSGEVTSNWESQRLRQRHPTDPRPNSPITRSHRRRQSTHNASFRVHRN